jgi:aminopeptidase N
MSIGNVVCPSGLLILVLAGVASGQNLSTSDRAEIVEHRLTIELNPTAHELAARDETTLDLPPHVTTIAFTLAPALRVDSVVLRPEAGRSKSAGRDEPLAFTTEQVTQPLTQRVVVTLPETGQRRLTLAWTYRGALDDPPKEPRHLRFVTPSETAGHIGPEGVYLSSESQWYPDIEGSLSRFRVTADLPREWAVVTQGTKTDEVLHETRRVSTWVVHEPSEALTLVANRFVIKTRGWKGSNGQQVQLATYFFPDHAGLADEYLEATANYLDVYVPLLGDYPFDKFAVVENFFASGLGMPSFTLLGSGSIERHYVQPYALGHEIVHSWIGNSVFNRADHGNWVEGLTTYLANYYWHEVTRDAQQAREQRRLMMQGYSLYVSPDRDYPVAQFMRKRDETDNAIGYQKAAFVFHLLRQEIGEDSFWRGLKRLVSRFRNRPADWGSLERVFAEASGQDLRWFFAQWVEQPGAPEPALGESTASRMSGADTEQEAWKLTVRITQAGKPFRLAIPVDIVTRNGTDTRWIPISRGEDRADLVLPVQPLRVRLDPDLQAFRRLPRASLPPMLNMYVTDAQKTVVRAFEDPASPLQQVVARITGQEASLPGEQKRTQISAADAAIPLAGSVLVLAGVEQQAMIRPMIRESCGSRVALQEGGFQLDGRTYEGPTWAVLFSCHRRNVPGSVITVLYGVTPQAVAKVSRLLFYYGWQSVVVFHEGAVDRREVWEQIPETKEVHVNAHE